MTQARGRIAILAATAAIAGGALPAALPSTAAAMLPARCHYFISQALKANGRNDEAGFNFYMDSWNLFCGDLI